MKIDEIENAEKVILSALAEKQTGNVLLQPWMDGWLIHIWNEQGNREHTYGAATLYEVINKLGSCK